MASCEHAVHPPAQIAGVALHAVTATKNPVTPAAFFLDAVIVADRPDFPVAAPPFAVDPFWSVTCHDIESTSAPLEAARRLVGQQRDHTGQRFRPREQSD